MLLFMPAFTPFYVGFYLNIGIHSTTNLIVNVDIVVCKKCVWTKKIHVCLNL